MEIDLGGMITGEKNLISYNNIFYVDWIISDGIGSFGGIL